jgi:ABC-2 type transport system permease protein
MMSQAPRTAMVRAIIACDVPLPIGYAFLLADRLVRDHRLAVADLLDSTPSSRPGRLIGKYLGCAAGAAIPIAIVYFGFAVVFSLRHGSPAALAWALAMFASITGPALLFVGAVSLSCPLVMPAAVFRIGFVGYWVWSSYLVPPRWVPTLTQTVVYPMGGYPIQVFFGYRGGHGGGQSGGPGGNDWAGPVPGALFNLLRPAPSTATAGLSIGLLLALAGSCLTCAHLLRGHSHR